MANNDLAIVGSPLQLLCAVEASLEWSSDSLDILFVDNGNVANTQYTQRIAKFLSVGLSDSFKKNCAVIRFSSFCLPSRIRQKIKKTYGATSYRNIYFGNMLPHIALFAFNIRHQECIAVDDGVGTVNVDRRIGEEDKKITERRFLTKIYKSHLENYLPSQGQFSLYTLFPNERFAHPSIKSVNENKLSNIGGLVIKKESNYEAWIIGQPLSEFGLLKNKEKEFRLLVHIAQVLGKEGYQPIYFPHRMEDKKKLDGLIKSKFIYIRRLETILEHHLLLPSSEIPSLICAVSSTCLRTNDLLNFGPESYLLPLEEAIWDQRKNPKLMRIRECLNRSYGIPYLADKISI